MFCKECGSELRDGIKFCENCGSPVNSGDMQEKPKEVQAEDVVEVVEVRTESDSAPEPAPTPAQVANPAQAAPTSEKKPVDTKLVVIIAAIAAIVVIAVVVIVCVVSCSQPASSQSPDQGQGQSEPSGKTDSPSYSEDELVDDDNPTLTALVYLDGEELSSLLEDLGFKWNSKSSAYIREKKGTTAAVSVHVAGRKDPLDEDEFKEMSSFNDDEDGMSIAYIVSGYDDFEDIFDVSPGLDVEEQEFTSKGSQGVVLANLDDDEGILIACNDMPSGLSFVLMNAAMIASGDLGDDFDNGEEGLTAREVWDLGHPGGSSKKSSSKKSS